MLLTRIISTGVILLMYSIYSFSQSDTEIKSNIIYNLHKQADSAVVAKLDSFDFDVIKENLVLKIRFNCIDSYRDYDQVYTLSFLKNYKKDTTYHNHFLARNSNRIYESKDKKYKLPVVFGDFDAMYKSDRKKYPYPLTDDSHIVFLMMDCKGFEIKKVWFNKKIPEQWLRK
ncbi:MAG: hypothetical protein HN704_13820 [Bacteroidetes bacterium]|jgi:hypothetical protein|nr:hypothetical protein [Bacteroidota bacterium]MBT6686018.1 hypothetical protein [Bacteroidota bacterium]MBT7142310.1 hypothetical protein [Bacteroidota bacterium]MBT7492674.1 hypothetical protein [Bacteroidota bacterium]